MEDHVDPTTDSSTHPVFQLTPVEAYRLRYVLQQMADQRSGARGLLRSRRHDGVTLSYIANDIAYKAARAHTDGVPLVEFAAPTYVKVWVLRAMQEYDIDIPPDRVRWVRNPNFS